MGWLYQGSALAGLSRYAEAYSMLLMGHQRFPHDEIFAYDLSCVCCSLGREGEALGWIRQAIAMAGFEIQERALDDPDLERIRDRLTGD